MASEAPIRSSAVVESRPSALTEPCRQILAALRERGFTQDDVFGVHLALEEAFLNAVKHGNNMDPAKKVTIEYVVDREKVEMWMTDEGEGFDPNSVPDPRVGDNLFRPEGRGLLLIRAYMHSAEYNDRGNALHMVRYRNQPISESTDVPTG
jgi:serine/threonine-protein kinase RsbW